MRMKVQGMRRAIAGGIGASVMVISAIVVVPAADAQGRPNTASGDVSIAGARSSQTFWTRRRMAAATPLDSVPVRNRAAARGRPETETHRVVPTLIRPTAGRHAPKAGAALRTSTVSARARAVPRPYTNVPDRLNGKVFFTIGGSPFVCSGTVVNSRNRDMVDTAGHCVSDGAGNFYENWVFVPAYSSAETG